MKALTYRIEIETKASTEAQVVAVGCLALIEAVLPVLAGGAGPDDVIRVYAQDGAEELVLDYCASGLSELA